MADTGWLTPASAVSSSVTATTESTAWTTISNAFDDDYSTRASSTSSSKSGGVTEALVMTQFGFSGTIPSGAVVDGIELQLYQHHTFSKRGLIYIEIICPGLNGSDYSTQAISSFTAGETEAIPYSTDPADATIVSTADGDKTYHLLGGSSSLWISGVERSHVVATGFGFTAIVSHPSASDGARFYELSVRVHYTEVASDPMSVRDAGLWKTASPFVRDSGIWKPATPSTRTGGIWKAS